MVQQKTESRNFETPVTHQRDTGGSCSTPLHFLNVDTTVSVTNSPLTLNKSRFWNVVTKTIPHHPLHHSFVSCNITHKGNLPVDPLFEHHPAKEKQAQFVDDLNKRTCQISHFGLFFLKRIPVFFIIAAVCMQASRIQMIVHFLWTVLRTNILCKGSVMNLTWNTDHEGKTNNIQRSCANSGIDQNPQAEACFMQLPSPVIDKPWKLSSCTSNVSPSLSCVRSIPPVNRTVGSSSAGSSATSCKTSET